MANAFSRPEQTPEPWPITPNAHGALPGDLPLTMPRRAANSATVVITKRDKDKKITLHKVRRPGDNTAVQCKIDTDNEWILRTGVALTQGRVFIGKIALARIVASRCRPVIRIGTASDRDKCNDTRQNLHWVTAAFNAFNIERKEGRAGYIGVTERDGRYDHDKTAARVYDLLCTLAYGDQLEKTPHLLNNLDQDTHVSLADTQPDGVYIYKVDEVFVVIYEGRVNSHRTGRRQTSRSGSCDELKAQKAQKERELAEKAKNIKVERNKKGIAVIRCTTKATDEKPAEDLEVLLDNDNKDRIDLHARSARAPVFRVSSKAPPTPMPTGATLISLTSR